METVTRILAIDDERIALKNLEHVLKKEGYQVRTTTNGQRALSLLRDETFDVVLTDLRMEKVDGMQILKRCKELYPETEVIMITGYATIETAIEATKSGAYHYLTKPFKLDEVRKVVKEAAEKVRLKQENRELRESLEKVRAATKVITQSPRMLHLLDMARDTSASDCNILITGESGTGKELIARYIHECSRRAGGPFIGVNCGAFPEELLANELFGHEKGAFTGAVNPKPGLVEVANRGTLFLDEITEMSTTMQVKLLRVLQEREYLRLGGTSPVKVDVRFLAASNRDLSRAISEGIFRQDLYYRLNVVQIRLPTLAERKDDIALLSRYFLDKYGEMQGKKLDGISKEALEILKLYSYPGNVRELENIIERGVALAKGNLLDVTELPDDLKMLAVKTFRKQEGKIESLEDQERRYISWVLSECDGNKTKAAQRLGIDRVSLWRKLKKYGLDT